MSQRMSTGGRKKHAAIQLETPFCWECSWYDIRCQECQELKDTFYEAIQNAELGDYILKEVEIVINNKLEK